MKKLIYILTAFMFASGCSFKGVSSSSNGTSASTAVPAPAKTPPTDLVIQDSDGKSYALIDYANLDTGDYQLDLTKTPQGLVEFPFQNPIFTPHACVGTGFDTSYESKRQTATQNLKILFFVDGKRVYSDHYVVSQKQAASVAIYAEYGPVSDFFENGALPNQFTKSFEPQGQCHMMCPHAEIKPVRPVIFDPNNRNYCALFMWGADGKPHENYPGTIFFDPINFGNAAMTPSSLSMLENCGAVQSNDDLKVYFAAATAGPCSPTMMKGMFSEYYYVEEKIPFNPPVYTITNFKELVNSNTETQKDSRTDFPVQKRGDWL